MPPKKTAETTATSFEDSLKRLETIVEELESGELSLEDSIARYEEGVRLSRGLTAQLDDAEKRIERLAEREGEAPTTQPMEIAGDEDVEPGELPF
jgi:exodeoxyribonuclease VII small subunit